LQCQLIKQYEAITEKPKESRWKSKTRINMRTVRINLNGTREGDLLRSILVKKADSYEITIKVEIEKTVTNDNRVIPIEIKNEIIRVNISPKMPIIPARNVKLKIIRGKGNKIVVTLDEPFIAASKKGKDPDSKRKRSIRKNAKGNRRKSEKTDL